MYLAPDGKYRNWWSHKVLIPTEEQTAAFALLDAATDDEGRAYISGVGTKVYEYSARCRELFAFYNVPGDGTYEGED